MADISKVKTPDGNTYNVKDSTARDLIANKADKTVATTSANGLMSASDKKAIDREFFRMLPKGGTYIPANADLNSIEYIKVGNYYNSSIDQSKTIKNIPYGSAFLMYVLSPLDPNYDDEGTSKWLYRLRIFIDYNGYHTFTQFVYKGPTYENFKYETWVKLTNSNDLAAVSNTINTHIANKSNPHAVTKAQVGLGSVANLDQSKAIKSITRSGTTFTATALDGTTTTFTQQDNNTTYSNATTSAAGLMSSADKAKLDGIATGAEKNSVTGVKGSNESSYRTGNINITKANIGLSNVDNTADSQKAVKSAVSATNDSQGQQIDTTYIKELSALGRTITAVKGNGASSIFNIAGDDLYLFYRGVATGDLNKLTTTGIYYVMSGGLVNNGPSNIDITYCYLIIIGFAALKQQFILKPDSGMILMRSYLGQHTVISQDDNLLDENSQPVLDEAGNVVTATFKTPPEIASNSKAVWSRWYKINGIGV